MEERAGIQPRVRGGDRDLATGVADRNLATGVADRLGGVQDQVHQHLAQLRGVALDRREPRQLEAHPHLPGDGGGHQIRAVARHLREVHRLRGHLGAPPVGQELPGEVRGALADAQDLVGGVVRLAPGLEVVAEQARRGPARASCGRRG